MVLSEDEAAQAIYEGRKKKYFQMKQEAYWASVDRPEPLLTLNADEWLELFMTEPRHDLSNATFKTILTSLCAYFSGDERFEVDGKSLKKGLMLMGPNGSGKSHLLKFFRHNSIQSFKMVQAIKITADYKEHGEPAVKPFYNITGGERNKFGKDVYGHCIDDVGAEETPAKYYGQEKNVIAEILQFRYDTIAHNATHITTNLTPEQLQSRYGSRAYDRMKEMFNVIPFNGIPSFRK